MATLNINDIAYGEIEFRRRTYPTGKFMVQSGVAVSEGDLIDLIANYTTNGGTSSTTLYKGRIVDRSFEKVKTITTESEAEEMEKVRPQARYSGTLGGLIQDLAREEFNYLSMTLSASSPYMYRSYHNFKDVANFSFPPLEHTPYGWINYSGGSGTKHAYVLDTVWGHRKVLELYSNAATSWAAARYEWAYQQEVSICNYDIWIATNTNTKQFTLRLGNFYHYPVYDGVQLRFENDGKIYYRNGYSPDTWVDTGEIYAANTYYRLTFYLDGGTGKWALDINGVNKLTDINIVGDVSTYFIEGIHIITNSTDTNQYVWIDAPGFDQDKIDYEQNYILGTNQYYEMDQLNYDTGYMKYILAGDMTLRQYFDMYADQYLYTWYIKPDYELLFNDGAVDSGVDLGATSNVRNIDGKKQIKNFDKVILLGGFVGGSQLEASFGAGNVIVKDTYAGITDYDVLLSMAEEIYNQKIRNPISVALDYLNLIEGYIQVGEELTIIGNVFRFKRSEEYICTSDTQFKLKGVKVYIVDGQIEHIELFLDDVLVFEVRGVDEELPTQNSALINQVGSGGVSTATGVGGESNSMVNIGTAGVGVYKQKTGVQFEMKNINAGSNKITITDDTGNNEIDIDLDISELLENPPTEDLATKAPTSQWAFDHKANAVANIKHLTDNQVAALHARYTDTEAKSAVTFGDVDSGTDFNSHSEQVKAGFHLAGGGTITVDGSYRVGWTSRMMVIAAGRGTHFSTNGFFQMDQPTSGVITAVGGGTANTWNASGIIISGWNSLYYILPIGSSSTSIAANFRMVGYTSDLEIPDDWILIAKKCHEAGAEHIKFGVGIQLNASETWVQGTASMIKYTNAQAVAAVNAAGLTLAATKVIDSENADLTFKFGRTQIDSRFATMMTISNRAMITQDQYAFGQTTSGSTYINAPTGQLIHLHINDIMKMSLSVAGLTMGIPIAMGTNSITLGAGQTVDGKDVSGLATAAEAHAYVEANALTLENALAMGANNITNVGIITITTEIQHEGDSNNSIAFGTDTQTFEVGGSTKID
ncbi:MAG TPA: hypothetical protein ENI23_15290, partial [bacterium]|nr:hypothetical protein [bacterium]